MVFASFVFGFFDDYYFWCAGVFRVVEAFDCVACGELVFFADLFGYFSCDFVADLGVSFV